MRNMMKAAGKGRKIVRERHGLDLYQEDVLQLMDYFKERAAKWGNSTSGACDLAIVAYYAGIAVGIKNARRPEA